MCGAYLGLTVTEHTPGVKTKSETFGIEMEA
jgi:hypothetical protein